MIDNYYFVNLIIMRPELSANSVREKSGLKTNRYKSLMHTYGKNSYLI